MRRFVAVLLTCLAVVGTTVAGFSFAGVLSPKAAGVTTNVTVHMGEYYFRLSQLTVPVGTVVFTVINDGDIQHNFAIAGKTTPLVNHGETVTLTVNFTNPGVYQYVCNVGEHSIHGMYGELTVTGSATTTTSTTTTTTTTTTPPPKPTATVKVSEKEFKISLLSGVKTVKTTKVVKGKKVVAIAQSVRHGLVRFLVTNNGKIAHNFVIAQQQTLPLGPGQKASLDVTLNKGKYKYLCSIIGHAAAGMKGTLTVT